MARVIALKAVVSLELFQEGAQSRPPARRNRPNMSTQTAAGGGWSLEPVLSWLFGPGRLLRPASRLIEDLGLQLVQAQAPVRRLRFSALTLHPLIRGWSATWDRDDPAVERDSHFLHGVEHTSIYLGSPMAYLHQQRRPFRRQLTDLDAQEDHAVLHELAAAGHTDYLALPLVFSDDTVNGLTLTTAAPEGFSAHDLEQLQRLAAFLTPVLEVAAVRRTAGSLLETYLGRWVGQRVLEGLIRRGDGERMAAAIWYSDLRDFTRHTETLSSEALLELLNDYFGSVSTAATDHGGEVLDYIGDAMLIAFPMEGGRTLGDVCAGAVAAARAAFERVSEVNGRRHQAGGPPVQFGVGLDVGEVIIGNVGAVDRLNFVVRGPAVNRAARIENLTKELGYPLLVSAAVQDHLPTPVCFLGQYAVKGISQPLGVYAPGVALTDCLCRTCGADAA